MTIHEIEFFIKKYEGFIPINKFLIKKLGLTAAAMYAELINRYKYFKKRNTLKEFGGDLYFFNTVEDIQKTLGLSAHQQRNAIKELVTNKLIKIKYGRGNVRYFYIEEDIEPLKKIVNETQTDN